MILRNARPTSAAAAGLILLCAGAANAEEPSLAELRGLTIEQLANLQITSVSRRPESLSGAPAAIEVITADHIRRSGVQSLPEVLRLARNLEVAQVDSQRYAISARGFNSFQASNKLLVLIDGRSVYTPLYSGVFWDQQHVPLQDIERIEVISGPGGTLWGANAVNGVVNIITQSAAATQGFAATAYAGDVDQRVDVRYGAAFGENGHFRVSATGFERGPMLTPAGDEGTDDWGGVQGMARADWGDVQQNVMLQAALYQNEIDSGGEHTGGHALARWRRLLESGDSLELQAFYSNAERQVAFINQTGTSDTLEMWDVSLQHNIDLGERHQIVWGGGYRLADSEFINTTNIFGFGQPARTLHTANVFIQDEIALTEEVDLTLGLKLEDHSFTDLEYMPNVRIAWRPNDEAMIWASVSRAIRTPSRIDRELMAPGFIEPGGFISEEMMAYELGYRGQPTDNTTVSATLYFQDYENLRTSTLSPPAPGGFPARVGNGLAGEVYGLEMWGDVAVTEDWRLSLGATLLGSDFRTEPLSSDVNGSGDDPGYQVFIRSHNDLTDVVSLDLALRVIDEVHPQIPAYTELGARLAWQMNDRVELALAGENLLHDSHPEAIDGALLEARRRVSLSARVTY